MNRDVPGNAAPIEVKSESILGLADLGWRRGHGRVLTPAAPLLEMADVLNRAIGGRQFPLPFGRVSAPGTVLVQRSVRHRVTPNEVETPRIGGEERRAARRDRDERRRWASEHRVLTARGSARVTVRSAIGCAIG